MSLDCLETNIDAIRADAVIYKKEDLRPLSNYHVRINEEAVKICENNPSMLRSRSALLEAARSKVNESYQFKKGKSLSKRGSLLQSEGQSSVQKCPKMTQSIRVSRMKSLEEDIKSLGERISYKEKRRKAAEDVKNYRLCDEITEEIMSLSREKRELTAELKLLNQKECQSKSYFKRKSRSSKSGSESSS